MSDPPKFTARGRTYILVPSASLESWSEEKARARLRDAAGEWPAREDILRLSDATFGPDEDLARAIEHLAAALDRGRLVAVRVRHDVPAGARVGPGGADWDDIPRLSDLLHVDGADPATVQPPRPGSGDHDPVSDDPRTPGTLPTGPGGDTPTDTWTSFVGFAVVDQHGQPLRGRSRCTVDGSAHGHALGDAAIDIRPIPTLAHVVLALDSLALRDPPAAASA